MRWFRRNKTAHPYLWAWERRGSDTLVKRRSTSSRLERRKKDRRESDNWELWSNRFPPDWLFCACRSYIGMCENKYYGHITRHHRSVGSCRSLIISAIYLQPFFAHYIMPMRAKNQRRLISPFLTREDLLLFFFYEGATWMKTILLENCLKSRKWFCQICTTIWDFLWHLFMAKNFCCFLEEFYF